MPIEDPMLPTLMTGQPAQGGGFGQAPKPSPKPPQQPGFQNQTANKQWWGGGAPSPQGLGGPSPQGATSGYGTGTPVPPPPPAPPAGGGTGTPATGTPPATPAPVANPNQGYIDMLNRELISAQQSLAQAQMNGGNVYNYDTGKYEYDQRGRAKVNMAMHEITRLQGELAKARLKAQQGGYS